MSNKKIIIYSFIFLVITSLLNLYFIGDSQRKFYDMHKCSHQLVQISESMREKIDRNFKEIQNRVANSEKLENLELEMENLELKRQNEKLILGLFNMFNILKGREMPLSKPQGKVRV